MSRFVHRVRVLPQKAALVERLGVVTDSIGLEIKGGGTPLYSTYQLRLMTYRALVENEPLTILTTRTPNAPFADYLARWGVTVEAP